MKNDNKILELTTLIKEKKEKLVKVKKFTPLTNCSLELDGARFNLNVLDKAQLTYLLVKLNSLRLSIADLKIRGLILSGYDLADWITDAQSRLDILSVKEEENGLKALELKLEGMLSNEKKTELEIEEIEHLLKG